jgi:glutamate dehydrogenase
MRERLKLLLDELSRPPSPPVPPMELAEVEDFLRWLDDDNFTFLGYREYLFDSVAGPAREPLGILRDEAHPVFGGLRDLSALPPDLQNFLRRRELLVITKSTAAPPFIERRRWMRSGCAACRERGGGRHPPVSRPFTLAYSRSPHSIPAAAQGPAHRRAPGWRRKP